MVVDVTALKLRTRVAPLVNSLIQDTYTRRRTIMAKISELNIGDIFVTKAGSSFDYEVVRKFPTKVTAKDQFGFLKIFDNDTEVYDI
jgi:hypothetical protein